MLHKSSLEYLNEFKSSIITKIRGIYLNSSFYNNKISKLENKKLIYKPNPNIFYSIVKFKKKKEKIENFNADTIWTYNDINNNEIKKLNNFFWLFSLDLKSSSSITQSIIVNWIKINKRYNNLNWEIDILSKRIISWISNSSLTYENSSEEYKNKFNFIIRKQVSHLKNEIDRSDIIGNKMIGCTALILTGLSYQDSIFLNFGMNLLKKIIRSSLDEDSFPKSRSFRQLVFYLKYFVLIRELLKDSRSDIPDYLNEIIFYMGQNYNVFWQSTKQVYLFNGSKESDYNDFDEYLIANGYKFSLQKNEIGNYALLNNKKNSIVVDLGSSPERKFSETYQAGALSFEFTYLKDKLICNSGYFQNQRHQLNNISRTTAAHSTLTLNNSSICNFKRGNYGKKFVDKPFKVFDKKISKENNKWLIEAKHDGYQKKYGIIHHRIIEFYPKEFKLIGCDKIISQKKIKRNIFELRFHMYPGSKITKTIDGSIILIEIGSSGWKFKCENNFIDIEDGLFFGKKNSYKENQNICVYGETGDKIKSIKWEFEKI
tara:strand:+ start:1174 stop:2802 length:1629 start_codon:yes stop_codon:yes gene_type:complete